MRCGPDIVMSSRLKKAGGIPKLKAELAAQGGSMEL